jgi:arylsulfatase A-like enzyme
MRYLLIVLFLFCAPPAIAKPNIILILADDLGWRDVGFNDSEIQTPHLDGLAEKGRQLTHFYAHPTCSPTRASLMTGQSALRLGVTLPFSKLNPTGLPIDRTLLPQFLQQHGYQTALAGKWHLGPRNKAYLPNARGFESFYGHVTGGVGYWDHVHGGHYDWQRDGVTSRDEGYATHLVTDEALRVLRTRDKSKPLFLYLAYGAPHLPNEAPADALAQYRHIGSEKRRTHAAMVSEMDAGIGRVLKELAAQGMSDDTLIMFMSDNGGLTQDRILPPIAYHLLDGMERVFGTPLPIRVLEFIRVNVHDGAADNGQLRGGKGSVLEGGIRVPALIHWPSQLKAGVYDERMHVTDVLPTIMQAVTGSADVGQLVDGQSRWPSLALGAPMGPSPFVAVGADGKALFRGRWKLIERASGEVELYDIADDPLEERNLAPAKPEITAQLQTALAAEPVGPDAGIAIWKALLDPDEFGGEERLPPIAELAFED